MTKDDWKKDGMAVTYKGRKFVANDIELCGDGSYVVHLAVVGKDAQLRVPISEVVEVAK